MSLTQSLRVVMTCRRETQPLLGYEPQKTISRLYSSLIYKALVAPCSTVFWGLLFPNKIFGNFAQPGKRAFAETVGHAGCAGSIWRGASVNSARAECLIPTRADAAQE
jgi:hypothetical protein